MMLILNKVVSLPTLIITVVASSFLVKASLVERFFIRSLVSEDPDLCLSKGMGKGIVVLKCDYHDDNQKWTLDDFGRLQLGSLPDAGCIKYNTTDLSVSYKNCLNPDIDWVIRTRAVVFGMFSKKIHVKGDCKVLTVDDAKIGSAVTVRDDIPGKQLNQTWETIEVTEEPSVTPTSMPSESPNFLEYVGQCGTYDRWGHFIHCGKCEGNCDCDSDCVGDLRCAHRSLEQHEVPGCEFDTHAPFYWDLKMSSVNFCFKPTLKNGKKISYVGECGKEDYKCKKCQGDCDTDHDCASGLVCFHRNRFEKVPGCGGKKGEDDVFSKDICVDPADIKVNKATHHAYAHDGSED